MSSGLVIAMCGLVVTGLASIVGIWLERDTKRPLRWSVILSIVISLAILSSVFQFFSSAQTAADLEEDMARMLEQLDHIASESDEENPTLHNFISSELKAQSRANLEIVEKLVSRVEAEGGSAIALLSKYLPASELKWLEKSGKLSKKLGEDPAQASATRTQQKLKETEKNLAETEKKANELSQANTNLQSKLDASREALEKVNADVAAAEARLEELKRQAAELEESLKRKQPRGSGSSSGQAPIWQKG